MKFAHIADVHLGGWREPKLGLLNSQAFVKAIDESISRNVDFVLIAGDLFNTSIPSIEVLKLAVSQLRRLKEEQIPVYTIAGSHDFSPSGKTMLEVLEEAELLTNVCRGSIVEGELTLKFTTDPGTGAKITGILGKKGMLDKKYYESLDRSNLENEGGFKIFLFHTAITELKTPDLEKMESAPLSLLPRGFDYYAGGHVHIIRKETVSGYKNVIYPGPTFPNSFSELEKLNCGGMYIYDSCETEYVPIKLANVVMIDVECNYKTPAQVTMNLTEKLGGETVDGAIVLLRLHGILESGKISEINLKKIVELLEEKGAYFVMRNTSKLSTKDFQEIKVKADSTEDAEKLVVAEHIGQAKSLELDENSEKELVEKLMTVLDVDKKDGEKSADFESRIVDDMKNVFGI